MTQPLKIFKKISKRFREKVRIRSLCYGDLILSVIIGNYL